MDVSTAVSFNGIPATFTVVSGSEITATVPKVKTARGTVTVTTADGTTLSSIVAFEIL